MSGRAFSIYSLRTGFVSEPIVSISIVTSSPSRSTMGGLRANPTPCGVPVSRTVPGSRVVLSLRNAMSVGTSKIMSEVVQSCTTSPLSTVRIVRSLGFGMSSFVTSAGPSGQNVSNDLPRFHCEPPLLICQSAATHVVRAGVAEHVVERLLLADVLRRLADDDGQLTLVVDGVALDDGNLDRIAGVLNRRWILEEQDGILRHLGARFLGVLSVVEADAENRPRLDRSEQLLDREHLVGHAVLSPQIALDAVCGAVVDLGRRGAYGRTSRGNGRFSSLRVPFRSFESRTTKGRAGRGTDPTAVRVRQRRWGSKSRGDWIVGKRIVRGGSRPREAEDENSSGKRRRPDSGGRETVGNETRGGRRDRTGPERVVARGSHRPGTP